MATIDGTPNDDVLIGTPDADRINGLGGNDYIDGGAGDDDMRGGQGDDLYIVRDANDFIVELNNQGNDIVFSAISYLMGTFVDGDSIETLSTIQQNDTTPIDLRATGDGTRAIFGNYGNNTLSGATDRMIGFFGDDVYEVGAFNLVQIIENQGEGNDTVRVSSNVGYTLNAGASVETFTVADVNSTRGVSLTGPELSQPIIGNAGNNTLDGGSGGTDILIGGAGSDTYHVRHAGVQVVEAANGGTSDRIIAYFDFALGGNVNIEVLQAAAGTAPINLFGNDLANILIGNDGNNILNGNPGAADTMQGGLGDDIYRVNQIGDVVQDSGGNDTIFVHFSYSLNETSGVENLSAADQAGTQALNFTGNSLDNSIFGNFGANLLDGGLGGNDTLYGLAGDDTYIIRNAEDKAVEQTGQGVDVAYSYVSWTLQAGSDVDAVSTIENAATTAIDLTGNEFNQTMVGNFGTNVLDGKAGNDLLIGLNGTDTFAFTTALGINNVDTISDFSAADDTIALDHNVFTGLGLGALPAGAFALGTAAQDGDDRIIYNQATGQLFFDADGAGGAAAIQFATLQGAPAITAADFLVI